MKGQSKKILFSLPEELLKEMDAVAAREHRSRSELIREATRRYIDERGRGERPIDDPVVRDAVRSMEEIAGRLTEGFDSSISIREMRDSRFGRPREPEE